MRSVFFSIIYFYAASTMASTLCPTPLVTGVPTSPSSTVIPSAETPASIACIYGLTPNVPGCPINGTSTNPSGGWGAIAVIEGGDDPNAYEELAAFSRQFNLPVLPLCPDHPTKKDAPCFKTFYVNDTKPNPASDVVEHVIDIEWAHAMAPNASIYMVEGPSLCVPDVLDTVAKATSVVDEAGGGMISNSWSVQEFPEEATYDTYFQHHGIVYIGSSGDNLAPARYPSVSPHVISAGGTSIQRDANGNFVGEVVWQNPNLPVGEKLSGVSGGPSLYEPRPSYQDSVIRIVGTQRGTPDISFVADPRTGVNIYEMICTDLTNNTGCTGGWFKVGGTSLAAPALAGILNAANHRADSTKDELEYIYHEAIKHYHSNWHDITQGNNGYPALQGYDFTTGLGTPYGYRGK